MANKKEEQTSFGFKTVPLSLKEKLVNDVFSSVANKYDLMNDLMSFGMHRVWKKEFMKFLPDKSKTLLDLASGSGDIAYRYFAESHRLGNRLPAKIASGSLMLGAQRLKNRSVFDIREDSGTEATKQEAAEVDFSRKPSRSPYITISDINPDMLAIARDRFIDAGMIYHSQATSGIDFVVSDAMKLPFRSNSFGYCTVAFGIRNVTSITSVIREAYRVLEAGGKFICMEFSPLEGGIISDIYDLYSFKVIPKIGKLITDNEKAYQYLVESIRKFPKKQDFAKMIEDGGFKSVDYKSLNFGTVSIHYGYKL